LYCSARTGELLQSTIVVVPGGLRRRSSQGYYSDVGQVDFDSKKALVKALKSLDTPPEVLTGMEKAKVKTIDVFFGSSNPDVFQVDPSLTGESRATAAWTLNWFGSKVDVEVVVSGYSHSKPTYKIKYEVDHSEAIARVLEFFQSNELEPIPGEVLS